MNNFGDLLGPIIVSRILELEGIDPSAALRSRRMLAVGSILKLARDGDTVWGIGANGKSLQDRFDFEGLDVRAVRGPRTRAFLRDLGISAPEIYGDPGLLVGTLWTREELRAGAADRTVTIIPNLNDLRRMRSQGVLPLPPTASSNRRGPCVRSSGRSRPAIWWSAPPSCNRDRRILGHTRATRRVRERAGLQVPRLLRGLRSNDFHAGGDRR
ncbi:hypothetical protein Q0F99_00255 [Rathayibacter oskolensis]|uniref:hypothetical protein n=1 Tax=Rathayibacter oskolensis TaxID=1891671 RepID=UPI00265E5452|nr:hypothetical protein [Rathayibacter oskolensis]WKK71702.1 hypothetical protein Q0F99_00255 [Rathayibacter oskolensis]